MTDLLHVATKTLTYYGFPIHLSFPLAKSTHAPHHTYSILYSHIVLALLANLPTESNLELMHTFLQALEPS